MVLPYYSLPVGQRFAFIIEGMKKTVAESRKQGDAPGGLVILAICRLLGRLLLDFTAIAARVRAGTRRTLRVGPLTSDATKPCRAGSRAARARRAAALPYGPVPTGFAWLNKLAQRTALFGGMLQVLAADPEMAALLAADQRLNRIMRSLLWMLALKSPPGLLPPLPRRKPRPAAIREGADAEKVRRPRPLACIGPTTSARARSRILRSLNPKSRPLATPEERARAWGVPLLGVPPKSV